MNEGRKNLLKGSIAESLAVSKMIRMGLSVSMPVFKQCKYDAIVEVDGNLNKIQIKKGRETKNNRLVTKLSSGHYDSDGEMNTKHYTENDVDVFVIVDIVRKNVFWVNFSETGKSFTISYKKNKGKQSTTQVNYYKTYLIGNRLDGFDLQKENKQNKNKTNKNNEDKLERSVFDC